MSAARRRAFLSEGHRTGKLAVTRRDGSPHVTPVWFVLDGDVVVFQTAAETVKGRALRRDGRAALCVDDARPPYSFVSLEGTVELSEDLAAARPWSRRIAARYMGEERADAFADRNTVAGELLVRLTPTRTVAVEGIAS